MGGKEYRYIVETSPHNPWIAEAVRPHRFYEYHEVIDFLEAAGYKITYDARGGNLAITCFRLSIPGKTYPTIWLRATPSWELITTPN